MTEESEKCDHINDLKTDTKGRVRGEEIAPEGMDKVGKELSHLELSKVLAPPEIALTISGVLNDGCQEIVCIHHGMDPTVEHDTEIGITTGCLVADPPEDKASRGMVIDMEERDLVEVPFN